MDRMAHCSICKTELKGTYCYNCGQKATGKHLTIKTVVSDAFSNFFSIERSGFATVYHLIKSPSIVIDNYINGNSGYYKSPGRIVFYMLTLLGLSLWLLDGELLGVDFTFNGLTSSIGFAIFIFFYAFIASYIVCFKKNSFITHIVVISYLLSVWVSIFIILDLSLFRAPVLEDENGILILLAMIMFFIWTSIYTFKSFSLTKVVFFTILQIILFFGFIVLSFYLAYLYSPEGSRIELFQQ